MSMDASSDQTMSSQIDEAGRVDSPLPQQGSVDDEQNEDEQSKGSSQTVVVKQQRHTDAQQQQHGLEPDLSEAKNTDDQEGYRQGGGTMLVPRSSSFDADRKMMHVDDELEGSGSVENSKFGSQQGGTELSSALPARFIPPPNAGKVVSAREDSLIARMRDIVEGDRRVREEQPKAEQQQPSSSDSLNNQNENDSKASIDSAQQKRSRHSRTHCNRHHHHHHHPHSHPHHHRQSVSEIPGGSNGDQANPSSHHHHHHHHHHRHAAGQRQRAHSHHHHHHHHHHHQQQQAGALKSESGRRNSIQRSSLAQIDPLVSSSSRAGKSNIADNTDNDSGRQQRQANESKSSSSSLSSATLRQQQDLKQFQHSNNPDRSGNLENKSSEGPERKSGEECGHHHHHHRHHQDDLPRPKHLHLHHQHHSTMQQSENQQAHAHHHHHHHHHCHHRSHKKRLVLGTGNDQSASGIKTDALQPQQDGSSMLVASSSAERTMLEGTTNAQEQEHQQDNTAKRSLLQEITSQTNVVSSCCPYHEHQCAGQTLRASKQQSHHMHPNHHHHHLHESQHDKQANNNIQTNSEQQFQAKPHHHHHHHRHNRHHHHHHHGHYNKQRHRNKPKNSSKCNLSDQPPKEPSQPSCEVTVERSEAYSSHKVEDSAAVFDQQAAPVPCGASLQLNLAETNGQRGFDANLESEMHLDHEEEMKVNEDSAAGFASAGKANDEVVKMEMSPNSDDKLRMQEECEQQVDSTASDSNLITSIEVIPLSETGVKTNNLNANRSTRGEPTTRQQQQDRQQAQPESVRDSNLNAQDASSSGQLTKRDSNHGFNSKNRKFQPQQESHRVKEDGVNRLVMQMSSNDGGSKKSQNGNLGGGNSGQDGLGEHLSECEPLQPATYQQPSQSRQIIEATVPPDRRCRLCWCCCCPCSALSNRGNSSRAETAKSSSEPSNSPANKCPSLPNVPVDEIRAWGDSFDRLMKCSDGRKVFQDFLRCEYSEENILFWTACEELKAEKDSKNIAAKARDIYEDYISILSSKEVSLDSRVRDVINNNIKKPTSNIFDEAQLQIYTLMHRDSYPRFINSPMYKKLAQIQPSSRKSSS